MFYTTAAEMNPKATSRSITTILYGHAIGLFLSTLITHWQNNYIICPQTLTHLCVQDQMHVIYCSQSPWKKLLFMNISGCVNKNT